MSARSPYRPKPPAPEPAVAGGVPFGVQLLAFLAGVLILVMAGKSAVQDFTFAHRLTHLDDYYEPVPARWLKLDVRRDASGDADFYPDVLYAMSTGDTTTWGWRLSMEEIPRDSLFWVERLSGYRVGDTVTAYMRPGDPKDAFVEARTDGSPYRIRLRGVMGLAFCLFGGTLVVLAVTGWIRAATGGTPRPGTRGGKT